MATEVLFIQGGGAHVHDAWDHALVESLSSALGSAYHVTYPRMPGEADPHYTAWSSALREELARLSDGAILVGHSIGGTMLIHTLAEHPPAFTPGALVLIAAPFIGPHGWPSEELPARKDFGAPFRFPVIIVHGTNDETAPPKHARQYGETLPNASLRILDGRDHQLNNDMREVAAAITALRA
ncbi:MAG TPA: alpha/beta fold hydrolase [Kofleriaceae bacterium]|jgi:hypothetical protein